MYHQVLELLDLTANPILPKTSPAEGEGHEGFPPPPDKDLESPSSTRLEAPRGPATSTHEGALPPPCIVRKDPRVPHTARRGA